MAFGALGGSVTSSIARSIGARDTIRAEKLLWHSLYISCFGALAFLIIFFIFGEPLLRILGGTGALLEESLAYCFVYLLGAIVVWLSGSLTAALRGMGDMQFPAVLTVICAGIQVFFSAGFILGSFGLPKLGLVGSAWSMIVTAGFMALVTLIKISSPSSPVRLKLKRLTIERELFEDIFSVALPASLSPIMTVATVLLLTGLIGQFGTSAIAGYGIGSRVEFLLIPIVFGIGTAMTAMVGTNIGAKNIKRAEKIKIGTPMDPETEMGPLSNFKQLEIIEKNIKQTVEQGGKIKCGGKRHAFSNKGYYFPPTIIECENHNLPTAENELFGPVLSVMKFNTEDEVIEKMNDNQYGCLLYTSDAADE